MPKYVVLKDLPQGQQAGEIVDLNEDVGNIFLTVEAVRKITPSDERKTPQQRLRTREYNRRDLQAVDSLKSED